MRQNQKWILSLGGTHSHFNTEPVKKVTSMYKHDAVNQIVKYFIIIYYLFIHSICLCSFFSPPERHHWARRDRPVLLSSLVHDENFHHLLFSQHQQQVALDESRQYTHTSTASRMLHPTAAHLPQQNPIMVDLHDQVTDRERNLDDNVFHSLEPILPLDLPQPYGQMTCFC